MKASWCLKKRNTSATQNTIISSLVVSRGFVQCCFLFFVSFFFQYQQIQLYHFMWSVHEKKSIPIVHIPPGEACLLLCCYHAMSHHSYHVCSRLRNASLNSPSVFFTVGSAKCRQCLIILCCSRKISMRLARP